VLFALTLTACGGEGDRSTTGSSTTVPATRPAERTAPAETQAATKPTGAKRDGRKQHKAEPTSKREAGDGGAPAGKEARGGKEKQKPARVEKPEGERDSEQGAADLNSNEASGDSAPPRTSDSNQSKDREPTSVEGTEPKDANAP
jgi:hypothetical protein